MLDGMITLHPSGRCFLDRDRPFVPSGVNYWPASCGVEMWARWPEAEIKADLAQVRDLGLDTVRFFLRWQDFEIEEGRYEASAFANLDRLLGWCAELGLQAHPSLFVGFMSGGVFWPTWKRGRNLFADPVMVARSAAFAAAATRVIARHREHILAIDLGNEMNCLTDAHSASPADNAAWFTQVTAAVRAVDPGMLIVSGNDQNQMLNDWHRFDRQVGTDFLSMHGYPVPDWHVTSFDGMADPLCADLLPCYCAAARSFAPVMLQEFGTILTTDGARQQAYLSAMLPAARRAGANGFLWWCLRDIPPTLYPYTKVGMESQLGLVDAANRLKPGLETFIRFASTLDPLSTGEATGVALAWPRHWWNRDEPENPGNHPGTCSRRLALAFHHVKGVAGQPEIARLACGIPAHIRILVVAGLALDHADQLVLLDWVRGGGRLLWHSPTPMQWGPLAVALIGGSPMDYRARRAVTVEAFGESWSFPEPQVQRAEIRITTAEVVACDEDGLPAVGLNRVGQGLVAWALPPVEDAVAAVGPPPQAPGPWQAGYRGMLALLG
jgi:hypothetical protein